MLEAFASLKAVIFVLKNWKIIASSLAALAVGFGAAWFIQGVRVNLKEAELQKKKIEITALKKDLKDCQNANKTNQETIGRLKGEVAQTEKLCAARRKINNRKTGRIRQIDEIPPYVPQEIKKDGGKDEKVNSAIAVSNDALLNELSGMFNGSETDSKNRIHKTDRAGAADPASVLSCQMEGGRYAEAVRLYCLDAENAKNLLKNREIDKAYADELRAILEGIR